MASITSWTRLEPRVHRDDPAAALEARLRDPLWLLARQWQTGEFTAEDAGSPLQVQARIERAPLTRYFAGSLPEEPVEGERYDPARLPLEVLVERESGSTDLRHAFEAGLQFFRLLDRHEVGAYRTAYLARHPLVSEAGGAPLDPQTARLLRVANGRVPDGLAIAGELRAVAGTLPEAPPIDPDDRAAVLAAGASLLAWVDERTIHASHASASPWNPERMEYAFAVAAPTSGDERVLVASEYAHGHLDWRSFDREPGRTLGAANDADAREVLVRSAIPAPVTYRGMPAPRWWEFEDGQVNFGSMDAEPSNLLRLLFLGFALDYGNDWFLMPVELPADAIYRVTSLVVTDSFGIQTRVLPYTRVRSAQSRWRMFSLSARGDGTADDDDLLFLAPSLPPPLHGEPIEEVRLMRDEVANVAWAVERRFEDAGGRGVDRFEQYQQRRGAAGEPDETPATDGDLRYRLATPVPDYWFPLVPTRVGPDKPDIRLVRGRVLLERNGIPTAPAPLGRMLEPGRPLRLFEEEVGRKGAQLTRTYQYARWTDGSAHLWIGRRKEIGRGEGASGLRFDAVEPNRP